MTGGQGRALAALVAAVVAWGCGDDVTGPGAGSEPGAVGLAGKPSSFDFAFDFSEFIDCDGAFFLHRVGTESHDIQNFFDRSGNPVRSQDHARLEATLTHLGTGEVMHEQGNYHVRFDFASNEMVINGQFAVITDAGEGVVVKDVGRVMLDEDGDIVFNAGTHELIGENPGVVYCGAFAS